MHCFALVGYTCFLFVLFPKFAIAGLLEVIIKHILILDWEHFANTPPPTPPHKMFHNFVCHLTT